MSDFYDYGKVVNPARAGMILGAVGLLLDALGKPRASGDDPVDPMSPEDLTL